MMGIAVRSARPTLAVNERLLQRCGAEERDASPLAAVSIEVWLNAYVRDGVSPWFADYVLAEVTAQKFRNAVADPNRAIWVSENRIGSPDYRSPPPARVALALVLRNLNDPTLAG
jgi:hypothetical protein